MPKFSYQDYKKEEETRAATAETTDEEKKERPTVKFINNFLKNDKDFLIVRFPYSSPDDFDLEECHDVTLPGNKYSQRVECTSDAENGCPLCKAGIKKVRRFLVKAVAYITNNETNKIELVPVVWERTTRYSDELADKIKDNGDLSQHLFKIKRCGVGQGNTTYTTDILTNKDFYNDTIYPKDLSSVEDLDPSYILIRRVSKWLEANGKKEEPKADTKTVANVVAKQPTTEVAKPSTLQDEKTVDAYVEPKTNTPAEAPFRRTTTPTTARVDPTEKRPVRRFSNAINSVK